MQQASKACCRCSWSQLYVLWPHSSHYVYTVNNRAHRPDSHYRWIWERWGACIQSVRVCTVCEHVGLPRIRFVIFLFTSFDAGVTVDTALLRRRPATLLWADIRASMSSSVSSSENSWGRQNSCWIERKTASGKLAKAYLYFAQFSTPQTFVGGCTQLP